MKRFHSGRNIAGVTLIEVMISVLILGIGMLGVAAMQTTALRNNQSAMQRSQIVMQTYTILDAMRANRDAALIGKYNTAGMVCKPPTGGSLIQNDQAAWLGALQNTIGGDPTTTCGSIACLDGKCKVSIQWDDSRAADASQSRIGSATQTLDTVTQL